MRLRHFIGVAMHVGSWRGKGCCQAVKGRGLHHDKLEVNCLMLVHSHGKRRGEVEVDVSLSNCRSEAGEDDLPREKRRRLTCSIMVGLS